jgi:hypothetical protein
MASFDRARFLFFALALGLASGCSSKSDDDRCTPGDQDGVTGARASMTVLLNVSDTGYAVGGVDSGSTEPNITVQNLTKVVLTLTNVGTAPHGMQIACIPTGLPAGCPALSCFPDTANIAPLAPGASVTVTFVTPAVEGSYPFTDTASDSTTVGEGDADGSAPGLVGEFVLM